MWVAEHHWHRGQGEESCAYTYYTYLTSTEFTTAAAQHLESPPPPSPDPGAPTSAALVLLFLSQFENRLLQCVLHRVTTTPLFKKKKPKSNRELKHFQKCDSEMQQFKVQTEGN